MWTPSHSTRGTSAQPFSHIFQAPSNDSSEEDFTETCCLPPSFCPRKTTSVCATHPSERCTTTIPEKSIDKTHNHIDCAHTEHTAAKNMYTTYQMHVNINPVQLSITCYIQAPRGQKKTTTAKKMQWQSKQQISPFCSSLVTSALHYMTASSAQNKNTKLDF